MSPITCSYIGKLSSNFDYAEYRTSYLTNQDVQILKSFIVKEKTILFSSTQKHTIDVLKWKKVISVAIETFPSKMKEIMKENFERTKQLEL